MSKTTNPIDALRRYGFSWNWAATLPKTGSALCDQIAAAYLALPAREDLRSGTSRRATTREEFAARVDRAVAEQATAWAGTRSFDRLSPAQVRAYCAAQVARTAADLGSDALHAVYVALESPAA